MENPDVVIEINYNLKDPTKRIIKTNTTRTGVETILETWLRGQMGKGADQSKANILDEYHIRFEVALSFDNIEVCSDTGNKSLTCGIVSYVFSHLDEIKIVDPGEADLENGNVGIGTVELPFN